MRRNNNDWIIILGFIILAILTIAFNTWNAVQVCKTTEVYLVGGTQYSCKLLK